MKDTRSVIPEIARKLELSWLPIGLLILSILLLLPIHYNAMYGNFYENEYENVIPIRNKLVIIETRGKYAEKEKEIIMKSIALPIRSDLAVALTHAIRLPEEITIPAPFGTTVTINRKVEYEKYYIEGQELELVLRVDDISFFKASGLVPIGYDLGDSDKLEVGTRVFMFGCSGLLGRNFKEGVISMVDLNDSSAPIGFEKKNSLTEVENKFLHTAPTNPGDSGSPLFAKRKNKYEIVGIVNERYDHEYDGMGFAIKINFIKQLMQVIEKL